MIHTGRNKRLTTLLQLQQKRETYPHKPTLDSGCRLCQCERVENRKFCGSVQQCRVSLSFTSSMNGWETEGEGKVEHCSGSVVINEWSGTAHQSFGLISIIIRWEAHSVFKGEHVRSFQRNHSCRTTQWMKMMSPEPAVMLCTQRLQEKVGCQNATKLTLNCHNSSLA